MLAELEEAREALAAAQTELTKRVEVEQEVSSISFRFFVFA